MRRLTVLGLILTFCSSAGCIFGDAATSPTNYTIVSPVTETFQDTLEVKGSKAFSFTVGNPDPLRITLASITSPSTGVRPPGRDGRGEASYARNGKNF